MFDFPTDLTPSPVSSLLLCQIRSKPHPEAFVQLLHFLILAFAFFLIFFKSRFQFLK